MMTPALKAEWCAALRSGRYTQGRGCLRLKTDEGPRYCCLGVLCEVLGLPHQPYKGYEIPTDTNVQYCGLTLPPAFAARLGIPSDERCCLVAMNDQMGCTFPEIADWIEHNL